MCPSAYQRHKGFVEEMRKNLNKSTGEIPDDQGLYDLFSVTEEDLRGLREFAKGAPTEETSLDDDLQKEVEKHFQDLFGSGKRKHG